MIEVDLMIEDIEEDDYITFSEKDIIRCPYCQSHRLVVYGDTEWLCVDCDRAFEDKLHAIH